MSLVRLINTCDMHGPRAARRWVELGHSVTIGHCAVMRLELVQFADFPDEPALCCIVQQPHYRAESVRDLSSHFHLPTGMEMLVRAVRYSNAGAIESLLVEFQERERRSISY